MKNSEVASVSLEKMVRLNQLYSFYASLLTDRQREIFRMYYAEDFSLGEIAETIGISRQGVRDSLKRSEEALEHYETHLQLSHRRSKRQMILSDMEDLITDDSPLYPLIKQLHQMDVE